MSICEAKTNKTKNEIDKSTIKIGDFSILFSVTDRISRQKISEDLVDFN